VFASIYTQLNFILKEALNPFFIYLDESNDMLACYFDSANNPHYFGLHFAHYMCTYESTLPFATGKENSM
jgi:hypothetical protein